MDSASQSHMLDEAVCILLQANALEKGITPSFLPPAMVNSKADWGF